MSTRGLTAVGWEFSMARVLKPDLEGLAAAAETVRKGGLICYPTDTVYGLGCDPFSTSAIEKAVAAKGRHEKAMPVLVRNVDDAERLAFFTEGARRLADAYWPGPLTIVLLAREDIPSALSPKRTIGLRAPKHAICQQLLGLCSGYLVGTSANLAGEYPATSAEEIVSQLGDRVDIILDGGKSPLGVASTVVELTGEHLVVSREGPIARADVIRSLKQRSR
jgi:L-threonylcarbamoyladenylate synthase